MTQHAHSHPHTPHDWSAMADELEAEAQIFLPYVAGALEAIDADRPGRRPGVILDVGAGPGVFTAELARRHPAARVVAVDGAPELLERARERGAGAGVETLRVDLPGGLADLPEADLILAAQTVHHLGDQAAAVAALAGRLRPGGVLAVAEGGLPTRFLPRDLGFGRPGLQDRLDALLSEGFAAMRAQEGGTDGVREDWPGMLRAAGLTDVRARTFLVDRPAPLDDGARAAVARTLGRYLRLGDRLAEVDAETLRRLVDPDDPASIRRRGDAFVLAARTVFTGVAREV
ncbi:trans-aconitate 2-methyltransferase [Tsukamurella sp. 1534]|uniref:class I SAM-dependent methyltransferase n=1 Tax=Tsukamurella sp. 1534 TaxID=1151061 RepID=UPI000594BD21|nr:class I SAM-dependent methyltransferase [Tsukamurella sp. 1534]